MSTMSTVGILISVVVYLVGMLAIGIVYSKNNNSEDFYLGGRKLGPIVTAMSTEASDMSAYLLMGVPGLALFCGLAEASWTAIGLALGTYLNWLFVAKPLPAREEFAKQLDIISFKTSGSIAEMVVRGNPHEIQQKLERLHPLLCESVPLTLEEIFITEMEAVGYDYNNVLF